jgi:hypothetical protein
MERLLSERTEITHILKSPEAPELRSAEHVRSIRLWTARFLALCCLGLVPWIFILATTLPRHYVVGNWPLTWIGFDVLELAGFAVTSWALWKQRQILIPAAMITSTLLFSDAWFDVFTAHGHTDQIASLALALCAELPLSMLLCCISTRALLVYLRTARGQPPDAAVPPLWRSPLVLATESSKESVYRQVSGEPVVDRPPSSEYALRSSPLTYICHQGPSSAQVANCNNADGTRVDHS